jgi:ABC-type microcin C transport system permease subunit YejB
MPPYAWWKKCRRDLGDRHLVGRGGAGWITMFAYILKRLLLMVPTLLGVLLITFVIQFVPGGPVEQYLAEAKAGLAGSGAAEGGGLSTAARRAWTRSAGADQGAVRLRQAGARALRADAGPVRAV